MITAIKRGFSTAFGYMAAIVFNTASKLSGSPPMFSKFGEHVVFELAEFDQDEKAELVGDCLIFRLSSSRYRNFSGHVIVSRNSIQSHYTNGKWVIAKQFVESVIFETCGETTTFRYRHKNGRQFTLGKMTNMRVIDSVKDSFKNLGYDCEKKI